MKQSMARRILSFALAMVLLFTNCPAAFAAEAEAFPEPTAAVSETVETEATEPAESEAAQTQPTDTTESVTDVFVPEVVEPTPFPTESEMLPMATKPIPETEPEETMPEETVPAETGSEETVPEETTEETIPEETVPAELPFGLTGMPFDYVLSEEELEKKQAMLDNGVLEDLLELAPGEDYVENQVIASAATLEEADLIAMAFNGTVVSADLDLVLIELSGVSVLDAVTASMDLNLNLPVVTPNYISNLEPITHLEKDLQAKMPQQQSWHTWVQENMSNPDPYLKYPGNWDYQWMHDAVDTYAAWGVTVGESWVKVAVVDSGVQSGHPDLKGRVKEVNVGCGTGDPVGHGTHVAGIIAASMNNGRGGAGIAPGVSIYSYRCSNNDGSVNSYYMLQAIRRAANDGVHVMNISIGSPIYDPYEEAAIQYALGKNVTVVAAAGNAGSNTKEYPASYDGVISVAATDRNNTRAYFSSYGPYVDVAAPGAEIMSTVPGSKYSSMSGTSMAAPVVAGIAALYTSAMGVRVSPAAMERALEKACNKVSDSQMGAGLINAAKLFGGKPEAPYLYVTDNDYQYIYDTKYSVPCESTVWFGESEITELGGRPSGDQNDAIVFTVDGKNPSVKNGQIVNGMLRDDGDGIYLRGYAGQTVTIKAARINGMGVMGKVATLKVEVEKSSNIARININGPDYMVAGKSVTLVAEVIAKDSKYPVEQDVRWSIVKTTGGMYGARIDQKGKLTTPSGKTGTVTVRATSAVKSSMRADWTINVVHFTPVSKIFLAQTNVYTYVGYGGQLRVAQVLDQDGFSLNWELFGVSWKSSNPSVATVDQNGIVRGVKVGTATITCTSLDGSGKTAKCKVQVLQAPEYLFITGDASIAPGSSHTFKVDVYPAKASTKKLMWTIPNAPAGVSINPSTGKVTVASGAANGKTFTVKVFDADIPEISATRTVTIRHKCSKVFIKTNKDTAGAAGGAVWKSGVVSTVNLFSVDLPNTSGTDNSLTLTAHATNPYNNTYISWSSSDPDIVSVNNNGTLTAHKAGTATITLKAVDGSGKKATCKVNVTNPVSSISIDTSAPQMSNDIPYVGFGKSVKNTVSFADTYGKPGNQKVVWDFEVHEYNASGKHVANRTSTFKNRKLISISSSGNLKVSKAVRNEWAGIDGELTVTVYAIATDGTGAYGALTYAMVPLATQIKMDSADKSGYAHANGEYVNYFACDQWNLFGDQWMNAFTATSSNPDVLSVVDIVPTDQKNWYAIVFATGNVKKTSTAKITIKTNDGSNKSCSFSVKVYP